MTKNTEPNNVPRKLKFRRLYVLWSIPFLIATGGCFDFFSKDEKLMPVTQRSLNVQVGDLGHLPWDYDASAGVVWNFNSAVFTPILTFDERFNLNPGIVKDWQWDNESSSYVLKIDDALKFTNGRSVEARDLEFTFLKPFIADDYFQAQEILKSVKGIEAIEKGMKYKSGMCSGIKVESPGQIRIFLKVKNPIFLYSLGWAMPPVGPIEAFKPDTVTFKKWPIGSGKYFVHQVDKENKKVVLKHRAFEAEKNKPGKFPLKIVFSLTGMPLENKIDLGSGTGSTNMEKDPSYTVQASKVTMSVKVLDFNYQSQLALNPNFRKAVSLAFNRKEIFKTYRKDQFIATAELVPKGYYGHVGIEPPYNPKLARSLISELVKKGQYNGAEIKATYHGKPGEELPQYVKKIQSQLLAIGLKVRFVGDGSISFSAGDNETVLTIYGNPTNYVDPLMSFSTYLGTGLDKHHSDPSDSKTKKLFESATFADSRERRAEFIKKLTKHFHKLVKQVPLAESRMVYGYSDKVEKIGGSSVDYAFDFDKVELRNE